MRTRSLLTFVFLAFATCLWFASSNGPGEIQGVDRTGSPLSPGYCNACHNGGSFGADVQMALVDVDGDTISEYIPGGSYTLRVQVVGEGATGFGFQAVALDSDNAGAGTYGDAPEGIQVTNVNGVDYPEQSSRASEGLFEIEWNAPDEGAGPISFYVAGNAVNGNFGISGDEADTTRVVIQEGVVSSARDQVVEAFKLQLGPNPAHDFVQVQWDNRVIKPERLRVITALGQEVLQYNLATMAGVNQLEIPTYDFAAGIYFVQISSEEGIQTKRLLKR